MSTLVGLTIGMNEDAARPYVQALQAAGLEVYVLRSGSVTNDHDGAAARLMVGLKGLVMAGGGDIDPGLIGRPDAFHSTVYGVDPNRDRFERAMFEEAWRRGMPVLPICRGMQVVNWAMGGTLWADIDAFCEPVGQEHRHCQTLYGFPRNACTHRVALQPGSRLREIIGADSVQVNSIHHQSVARVADGWTVTAVAPDGVIEGMEYPSREFAVAVQFHPEELWSEHDSFRRLFSAFGQAAARWTA